MEVLLWGDSYYSCPAVYEFCEKEEIKYVFGFNPSKPLKKKAKKLVEEAQKRYAREKQPVKIFSEFFH